MLTTPPAHFFPDEPLAGMPLSVSGLWLEIVEFDGLRRHLLPMALAAQEHAAHRLFGVGHDGLRGVELAELLQTGERSDVTARMTMPPAEHSSALAR